MGSCERNKLCPPDKRFGHWGVVKGGSRQPAHVGHLDSWLLLLIVLSCMVSDVVAIASSSSFFFFFLCWFLCCPWPNCHRLKRLGMPSGQLNGAEGCTSAAFLLAAPLYGLETKQQRFGQGAVHFFSFLPEAFHFWNIPKWQFQATPPVNCHV